MNVTTMTDALTFAQRYQIAKMMDARRSDRRIIRQTSCTPEYLNETRSRLEKLGIATPQQLLIFDYVRGHSQFAKQDSGHEIFAQIAKAFGATIPEIRNQVDSFLKERPAVITNRLQLDYTLDMMTAHPASTAPPAEIGLRDPSSAHTLIHPEHWPGTMSPLVSRLWREFLEKINQEVRDGKEMPVTQEDEDRATALYQICQMQTQRVLIDTEQFNVFVTTSDHELPDDAFANLHWPFDSSMYIELTQPTVYRDEGRDVTFHGCIIFGQGDVRTVCFAIFADDNFHLPAIDIDINSGLFHATPQENPPEGPTRLAAIVCMVITYMTARPVKIVEEPLPRNVRRNLERKQLHNPFHVITTNTPRSRRKPQETPTGGGQHSYRYDVVGHIRFGRHLLADGTHRVTREWVRPHQRGLRNLLYIPATRRYSATSDTQPA